VNGQGGVESVPPHTGVEGGPFRGELLSIDRLAEEARRLAAGQATTTTPAVKTTPLTGLTERAAASLAADNATLSAAVREQRPVSPASEWLLDNYYLIEEQIAAVRDDLPARYGVELPRLTAGPLAGYPRVFEAAIELITHTDARLDEGYLVRFINAYQDDLALSIGEVWAVPIMLRVAIVENLRRLSREVVNSQSAEQSADEWAARLLLAAQDAHDSLNAVLEELDAEVAGPKSSDAPPGTPKPVFFIRLSQRLGGMEAGADVVNRWLAPHLSAIGLPLDEASHEQQQTQAANQVSIANSITAIRFIDAYEWKTFFGIVSVVERELRDDPAGVYPRMDFASRDRCRHALEAMARRCSLSEHELVDAVLASATDSLARDPSDLLGGHVAYYLVGKGRYALESSVGYQPTVRERTYRGPLRVRGLIYGGLFGGISALLVALVAWWANAAGAGVFATALVALLSAIPLSEIALAVTNRTLAALYPARSLLKLDFTEPVAEAHRTLVVVPALLSSVSATQSIIDNLEISYLANRDANIAFGLLGDLKAAAEAELPGDGLIVEAAVRGISSLNDRYAEEHGVRPFHLMVRARTFNETEKQWMGWERKRGALLELARVLRGAGDSTFTHKMGDIEFRREVTFVLTLDADTILPRDGGRKLISTIAHPANRAQWRPGDPRVGAGFGLVQPRVSMTLPGSRRSRFAWMYSGSTGIDPYVGAASDTYQDVFGEGSFTGKGIFELAVFLGVLEGRFADNSLLSHDLVEGSFLRTALATDVEVLDDYPASFATDISRVHRWIRGDWQTLPWLGLQVRDERGRFGPNPLSGLHRWKLVDNLRRSLVAPTTVLLATLGWLLVPSPALLWPALAGIIALFPIVFGFVDAVIMRPRHVTLASSARAIMRDAGRDLARGFFELMMLPYRAWVAMDATLRALWRMFVSRRHLLEWETADDAARRLGATRAGFIHRMWHSSAAGVALVGVAAIPEPVRLLAAVPIAIAWGLAPLVAWWVSLPRPVAEPVPLTEPQQRALRRIARKTWRYFDTFVTPRGHYLVPDNFQEDPKGEVAWRTSPTNIGLQLLAFLNAHDMGYITLAGLVERTSSTLAAMAGLERFRGHFFNWYDIETLEPLRPHYISTVDSGNLAGHLLVLRIGLLEASEAPIVSEQSLAGLRDGALLALEDMQAAREALGGPENGYAAVLDAREPGRLDGSCGAARRPCGPRARGTLGAARRQRRPRPRGSRTGRHPRRTDFDPHTAARGRRPEDTAGRACPLGATPWRHTAGGARQPALWRAQAADRLRPEPCGSSGRACRCDRRPRADRSREPRGARERNRRRPDLGRRSRRRNPRFPRAVCDAALAASPRHRHRARDVGAHGLHRVVRRGPRALLYRLQHHRGPSRRLLLRHACERVPARKLPRYRQGRRTAGALVPAGTAHHSDEQRTRARIVERFDVRVPHAAARHALVGGHAS
jgi:cyclic beta-1,2-glucan synthetase